MEVANWQASRHRLQFHLELPRLTNGQIELYLPFEPESATLIGPDMIRKTIPCQLVGEERYLVKVSLNRSADIEISKRD